MGNRYRNNRSGVLWGRRFRLPRLPKRHRLVNSAQWGRRFRLPTKKFDSAGCVFACQLHSARGSMSLQLLVILVPVLFGLMGFALDLGRLYLIRGELNEAANT